MSGINLLPWREWQRETRRRRFFAKLSAAAVAGLLSALAGGWGLDRAVARSQADNAILAAQVQQLDESIRDAAQLRDEEARLLARINAIGTLHRQRATPARVLEGLARAAAEGTHYSAISLNGETFAAHGVAASAGRISTLMRNIEAAGPFGAATLKHISEPDAESGYGADAVAFELSFSLGRETSAEDRP